MRPQILEWFHALKYLAWQHWIISRGSRLHLGANFLREPQVRTRGISANVKNASGKPGVRTRPYPGYGLGFTRKCALRFVLLFLYIGLVSHTCTPPQAKYDTYTHIYLNTSRHISTVVLTLEIDHMTLCK